MKNLRKKVSLRKILNVTLVIGLFVIMMSQTAFAATDMWTKAEEIMKDVYTHILAISTAAGVVTAAIALLLMNFSKSGKTVDEARAWLKRIIITWAILNGLGFIMAYISPYLGSRLSQQWTIATGNHRRAAMKQYLAENSVIT